MAIGIREHNWPWGPEKTYDVYFYADTISTTVTLSPFTVTRWISAVKSLHRNCLVGLDVEWRPSFNVPAHHQNPVATLQLCVGGRCLIYQILHSHYALHIPQSLADFLADYANVFVGVSIKSDLQKLQNDYGVGGNAHYVELGWLAAEAYNRMDLKNAGLKALASFVLGKEVEEPLELTVSMWDNWRLTAEQVKYACVDAFVSYEIGRALMPLIIDQASYRNSTG